MKCQTAGYTLPTSSSCNSLRNLHQALDTCHQFETQGTCSSSRDCEWDHALACKNDTASKPYTKSKCQVKQLIGLRLFQHASSDPDWTIYIDASMTASACNQADDASACASVIRQETPAAEISGTSPCKHSWLVLAAVVMANLLTKARSSSF